MEHGQEHDQETRLHSDSQEKSGHPTTFGSSLTPPSSGSSHDYTILLPAALLAVLPLLLLLYNLGVGVVAALVSLRRLEAGHELVLVGLHNYNIEIVNKLYYF